MIFSVTPGSEGTPEDPGRFRIPARVFGEYPLEPGVTAIDPSVHAVCEPVNALVFAVAKEPGAKSDSVFARR